MSGGRLAAAALLAAGGAVAWLYMREREAMATRLTAAQVAALVTNLNAGEFGSWFRVGDVVAVAEIESAFDPAAVREEPQIGDRSLGLMQVLTTTARDRGYSGTAAGLLDPIVNLRIGMRHLKWSHDYLARAFGRPPTAAEWIGSYNAGVGNVVHRGWWSAGYVAKWAEAVQRYAG